MLMLAYLVPGLAGHDPWKPDEPYTFGAVLDMAKSGDPVVPTVGEQPFVEKPPLYYWAAWGSASLLSPLLPLHASARVASFFFMAPSLGAVAPASLLLLGQSTATLPRPPSL